MSGVSYLLHVITNRLSDLTIIRVCDANFRAGVVREKASLLISFHQAQTGSVAKRVVYFIVSVGVSGCGVCLGVLRSFQPTAVGYACPYVWSGPWHSHPTVKLGKAGEPASQLRRGQLSTAIGWTFGVWAVLLWYMWVFVWIQVTRTVYQ